ncbi:MAG TPA: phosphodiester glycosidase family protein [Phenylobacterium sp.]|nr:phosphodiester glycosidase family protein [Phenylobacterium sp.]
MRIRAALFGLFGLLGLVSLADLGAPRAAPAAAPRTAPALKWTVLQPGLEYATSEAPGARELPIDGHIHLVRVDPKQRRLEAVMAGAGDGRLRTAAEWCHERDLAVAINMGMYEEDRRTNTGYARSGRYVNNGHWSSKYKAALGFGAKEGGGAPAVLMADLDDAGDRKRLEGYGTVVQNLRLIRGGQGLWQKQERRWSEAAVGIDKQGRLLFVFSRYPYAMKELNDILLALPLALDGAMHVEGGPEASLSIHAGGVNIDLNGSFETGFVENDGVERQWPIPNVLGVGRR